MAKGRKEPAPFLKICGIRTPGEAALALGSGATALGFLVGLTHRAEDGIGAAQAAGIIRGLPPGAETVLVTHLLDPEAIARLAAATGTGTVQVHGDLPVEDVRRLRALLPGRRLIKAVHVTGPEAVRHALAHATAADALLLDSRTADRLGGTGRVHDWSVSRAIVQAVSPLPVYLAGGLRPGNVEEAIRTVRPAGVDANSGVEDASGAKDPLKLREFLRRAAAALARAEP
ncbi:MAG: phosphoribosylanthranilate isomerase [Acetobacteraceae bacterium]|nr:phosphoribosylanthranilate isomerase [Acetobacteraceae bacterium]